MLNALLGLGTALAPVFVALFVGIGFWTGRPILAAVLLVGLLLVSLRLPLQPAAPPDGSPPDAPRPEPAAGSPTAGGRIPAGLWIFGVFAVLYGFCETMNGNWSQLDITSLG